MRQQRRRHVEPLVTCKIQTTDVTSAKAFLKALHKACPIHINKLLTDNGKEFTDRRLLAVSANPVAIMSSISYVNHWALSTA